MDYIYPHISTCWLIMAISTYIISTTTGRCPSYNFAILDPWLQVMTTTINHHITGSYPSHYHYLNFQHCLLLLLLSCYYYYYYFIIIITVIITPVIIIIITLVIASGDAYLPDTIGLMFHPQLPDVYRRIYGHAMPFGRLRPPLHPRFRFANAVCIVTNLPEVLETREI